MLLTKDEWWDVMRQAKPGITREQFDAAWVEFSRLKESGALR